MLYLDTFESVLIESDISPDDYETYNEQASTFYSIFVSKILHAKAGDHMGRVQDESFFDEVLLRRQEALAFDTIKNLRKSNTNTADAFKRNITATATNLFNTAMK